MDTFLAGLRALVPIFERAKLGWREEDAHDPWEQVSIALYQAIVSSAIDNGIFDSPICGLLDYDSRVNTYANCSYMAEMGTQTSTAFICFETDMVPFDVCRFATLDGNGKVLSFYTKKATETDFVFVSRLTNGTLAAELSMLTFEQ